MSKFHDDWSAAKTKFETDTGMKKPADMGKVFGISYRKGTGIDEALKELDKTFPESLSLPAGEKVVSKLQSLVTTLEKSASQYLDLLDKSIKEEKENIGKDKSKTYRDLKVLRAALEQIVSRARLDADKLKALGEGDKEGVEKAVRITVMQIKTLTQSLDAGVKASTLTAQEILKKPTAETFNFWFKGGKPAREVTQPLVNFAKWAMPNELPQDTLNSRNKAMQNEAVYKAAGELYHTISEFRDRIKSFLKEEGGTATDANLAKIANAGVELPGDASPTMVVEAVKHFLSEVKRARALANDLKATS